MVKLGARKKVFGANMASTHLFTLKGEAGKDKGSSRDSSKLHKGIKVNFNTIPERVREKGRDGGGRGGEREKAGFPDTRLYSVDKKM